MTYFKREFGIRIRKSLVLGTPKALPRQSLKWTIPYRAVAPLAMACDALIIFSMSMLSGVAYHLETVRTLGNLQQFAGFAAVVAALFITLAKSRDLYTLPELLNLKSQIRRVAIKWVVILLFLTAVAFTMKLGESFSRGVTLSFAISGLVALILTRVGWRVFLADGLAVRRFSGRKFVLIAEKTSAVESGILEAFTRHGLQMAHHFVLPADQNDAQGRKKVIAQVISSVRGSNIEEVVVSADLDHWSELSGLLSQLRVLPLPINLVPVGSMSELFKLSSHTIGDTVTIELQHGPRTLMERVAKRAFDIAVAGTGLVVHLPLLLLTAVAIKLDSPGPIIFRQWRRGFNGRPFQILKFRTLSVLEDDENIVPVQPNDTRLTRVGSWLRRTSIDELPQLLNVLQGTMSIVGPRPHAMAHDNQFDKLVGNYAFRHHVKPGLTGWAQVNGHRGQMRTIADTEQRIKYDLWYIDNWNLAIDFKIIFMTMIEIIRGENAY
jgi:Undecaprenyl-phosphate glucose phosphotransferase